jgi:hypothetical protein
LLVHHNKHSSPELKRQMDDTRIILICAPSAG